MPGFPPRGPSNEEQIAYELLFVNFLEKIDRAEFRIRVPQLRDHVTELPGLHFHFTPDLVIALRGRSRFEFIHESFILKPGDLAIIPEGIPHREVLLPSRGEPFENVVVSVYNQTLCILRQTGEPGEKAPLVGTAYFDTPKYEQLAGYLTEIAELAQGNAVERRLGVKGLLLAYFGALQGIVGRARQTPRIEKLKISQVKRQVREHLGDAALSVTRLAERLHCSGDYLSNLFHQETGQRLVVYINTERVKAAAELLRSSPLTISEIAFATGFESPGYFSRVFRQIAFKTPSEYRKALERSVIELEGRPRAVAF